VNVSGPLANRYSPLMHDIQSKQARRHAFVALYSPGSEAKFSKKVLTVVADGGPKEAK